MQNDETREICLNYAASVPEWNLALKHEAASELARCAAELMKVSQMMLASDAADRLHPDRFDYGLAPRGYASAISDAKYSLGDAAFALEIVIALARAGDVFPHIGFPREGSGLRNVLAGVTAAYGTKSAWLEDLCRRHGCEEVAYRHG